MYFNILASVAVVVVVVVNIVIDIIIVVDVINSQPFFKQDIIAKSSTNLKCSLVASTWDVLNSNTNLSIL